jgi:hypothetical protein
MLCVMLRKWCADACSWCCADAWGSTDCARVHAQQRVLVASAAHGCMAAVCAAHTTHTPPHHQLSRARARVASAPALQRTCNTPHRHTRTRTRTRTHAHIHPPATHARTHTHRWSWTCTAACPRSAAHPKAAPPASLRRPCRSEFVCVCVCVCVLCVCAVCVCVIVCAVWRVRCDTWTHRAAWLCLVRQQARVTNVALW